MKPLSFLFLLIATLLLGCAKSFEHFAPNPNSATDTLWANTFQPNMQLAQLYNDLQIPSLTDSFSVTNGGITYFQNNTRLVFQPNSFLLNGMPTDGKATIQFQLLMQKGSMVRMCKPTQSGGYLLQSDGEIYINVTKNGMPLSLAPGKQIGISYNAPSPNPLMKGFIGLDPLNPSGLNSSYNWSFANQNQVAVTVTPTTYQVLTSSLNWISCAYFKDSALAKITTGLTMPLGFNNTNTSVFIVFKNRNSIMEFDADAQNKIWIKGKVPINEDVIFVSISKRNNDYWLGTKNTTTALNQNIVLKPFKIKLQDLINYLASL